jgi:hypothetical protein
MAAEMASSRSSEWKWAMAISLKHLEMWGWRGESKTCWYCKGVCVWMLWYVWRWELEMNTIDDERRTTTTPDAWIVMTWAKDDNAYYQRRNGGHNRIVVPFILGGSRDGDSVFSPRRNEKGRSLPWLTPPVRSSKQGIHFYWW